MDDYGYSIVGEMLKPRAAYVQALAHARAQGFYIGDALEVGWYAEAWATSSHNVGPKNAHIVAIGEFH